MISGRSIDTLASKSSDVNNVRVASTSGLSNGSEGSSKSLIAGALAVHASSATISAI